MFLKEKYRLFDQNIRHPFLKGVKERYEATPTFNLSTFDDPNLSFDKLAVWFDEHWRY